jgi:hypothetical protein
MLTVTSFPDVGKSHLAAAVGHELILPVLWATTAALVQRLLAAKRDLRLPSELAKLDHVACLILDDMGYVQHDRDEMEVLFTLLALCPTQCELGYPSQRIHLYHGDAPSPCRPDAAGRAPAPAAG